MKHITIAIDGPAGAGKSTVARELAKKLGVVYLDTGAMYRAYAFKAIQKGINTNDALSVLSILSETEIQVKYREGKQHIFLDDQDVTAYIRTPEIGQGASEIARIPDVRMKLVEIQRKFAQENSVVMDGRDIGTYVLPNATRKIYLTASVQERAYRRWAELKGKGYERPIECVKEDIIKRDESDYQREFAPLRKADDAIMIDTTGLCIEQIVDLIIQYI